MTTRTCKECKLEKDLFSQFYKHHGDSYYHVCRACKISMNTRHSEPKVKGFAGLPQETKDIIARCMQEGKNLAHTARESGVKYRTLYHWFQTDQVHPVLVRQNAIDPIMEFEMQRLREM